MSTSKELSNTVPAPEAIPADGYITLQMLKPDGKADPLRLPIWTNLEADLIERMTGTAPSVWMAAVLSRHAPAVAARVRLDQCDAIFRIYMGIKDDDEATPGESGA